MAKEKESMREIHEIRESVHKEYAGLSNKEWVKKVNSDTTATLKELGLLKSIKPKALV